MKDEKISPIIIILYIVMLLIALAWKPLTAIFIYHDTRCILADCRILK